MRIALLIVATLVAVRGSQRDPSPLKRRRCPLIENRPGDRGELVSERIGSIPAVGEVGLVLDPWQAEVLRSPSKRTLMLCSRQSGKSTTAAIMSIGQAVTAPGSLTLLVSPSLRQSTELFRTVMGYFRKLSDAPEILAESVTRLELANGSRIVSLPGTEGTIRGYAAASLIVIDEAARVADELLAQCTPNACGIEWKAGRPLDSSAVTVPTPCVKIPRPAPMSASGGS
jgi:hypothetical protein